MFNIGQRTSLSLDRHSAQYCGFDHCKSQFYDNCHVYTIRLVLSALYFIENLASGQRNLNLDNSYHMKTDQRHLSRLMITCQRDLSNHLKTGHKDRCRHVKTCNKDLSHQKETNNRDWPKNNSYQSGKITSK